MLVFRWILLLLLIAAVLCFAMYVGTGELRWRGYGVRLVKWVIVAGFAFFAVLFLERMAAP
ncbi:MAG TPA: hypothetical protein VFZ93_01390 [Albitalea sp.]